MLLTGGAFDCGGILRQQVVGALGGLEGDGDDVVDWDRRSSAEEATRPSARCPCAAITRETMGGNLFHSGRRQGLVRPGQQQRV